MAAGFQWYSGNCKQILGPYPLPDGVRSPRVSKGSAGDLALPHGRASDTPRLTGKALLAVKSTHASSLCALAGATKKLRNQDWRGPNVTVGPRSARRAWATIASSYPDLKSDRIQALRKACPPESQSSGFQDHALVDAG